MPTTRQFDRLPAALRPSLNRPAWITLLWRERTRVNLARLLALWPDRLHHGRWAAHCRCVALEQLDQYQVQGRPVILAVLHFGPLIHLGLWLRARGLQVAALKLRPTAQHPLYRQYLDCLSDRAGGRSGLPFIFDHTGLRKAYKHLRAGRILAVGVEGDHDRHLCLAGPGFEFNMTTGFLRLAAATNAVVVPCLITAEAGMSFTIHLGQPVPDELVGDEEQHRGACDHLLHEFLEVVRHHPGQCSYELLMAFRRATTTVQVAAVSLSGTAADPGGTWCP